MTTSSSVAATGRGTSLETGGGIEPCHLAVRVLAPDTIADRHRLSHRGATAQFRHPHDIFATDRVTFLGTDTIRVGPRARICQGHAVRSPQILSVFAGCDMGTTLPASTQTIPSTWSEMSRS
jgi:hypothetical protein